MKLSAGYHPATITTGGSTSVTVRVTQQGNKISMGCETYTWSEEDGFYVGDHINAMVDFKSDGTLEGLTGTSPNVYAYGGTWS